MIPTTRAEFSQFIMRKLGAPVLEVNLSEEQVDDIIDQALYFYNEWHYNGGRKQYIAYQLQPIDVINKFIPIPENIIGVTRMFPLGIAMSSDALFNMRYQFIMNDLYSMTNVSLTPYYMVMQHIALLEEILVGQQPIRYNRHENKAYIDMDWSCIKPGHFIILESYMIMDPEVVPDVYRDRWLQDYTAALMKRQWGEVLSKYDVVLPSGMKINGVKIRDDADREVRRMEDRAHIDIAMPLTVFMA